MRDLSEKSIRSHYLDRIKALEDSLRTTRSLVCEGAIAGFNPHAGDWADRLYTNNGAISALVPVKEGEV